MFVNQYFFKKVQVLLETYFGDQGFKSSWHWARMENQNRGRYHAHGCLQLEDDPGLSRLAEIVIEGRIAQNMADALDIELEHRFEEENTADDSWCCKAELVENDDEPGIEPEQLQEQVLNGIRAERHIIAFQTMLLSTFHPDPPSDAKADDRDESTKFKQTPDNVHPSALDPGILDVRSKGPLLNAVQRHMHQPYCVSKKRKRSSGNTSGAAPILRDSSSSSSKKKNRLRVQATITAGSTIRSISATCVMLSSRNTKSEAPTAKSPHTEPKLRSSHGATIGG